MPGKMKTKGQRELEKKLAKLEQPDKIFDKDFNTTAVKSVRFLIMGSQGKGRLRTGNTARAWTDIKKLGLSKYLTTNNRLTSDKKHNIAGIINYGRRVVRPKKAKLLFIPLSNKGASHSSGMEFGVDFVLAKKAKAVKGTKFLNKEEKRAKKEIVGKIKKTIKRVANG